jgi:hypothetical protein
MLKRMPKLMMSILGLILFTTQMAHAETDLSLISLNQLITFRSQARTQALLTCDMGLLSSIAITAIHGAPIFGPMVSVAAGALADHMSGSSNMDMVLRAQQVNSNGDARSRAKQIATELGGILTPLFDAWDWAITSIRRDRAGLPVRGPQWVASSDSLSVLKVHYSRLIGEDSTCRHSMMRSAALTEEISKR